MNEIFNQHWQPLVDYLTKKLGDYNKAEEIAQETMIKAWKYADKCPDGATYFNWLRFMANHSKINENRLTYNRLELTDLDHTTHYCDPADHAQRIESEAMFWEEFKKLSDEEMRILIMFREGKSYRELERKYGWERHRIKRVVERFLGSLRDPVIPAA